MYFSGVLSRASPGSRQSDPDEPAGRRYRGLVSQRTVHVPYDVAQDEDGVWCAHAQLRPGLGAHGEGDTEEAAIADLREALAGLIEEFGVPRELTLTVTAA